MTWSVFSLTYLPIYISSLVRDLLRSLTHFIIECVCACWVTSVVSDPWWYSAPWPARLLCPWDSPGKNTGVNFCALLQGIFPPQGLILCLLCLPALSSGFFFLFFFFTTSIITDIKKIKRLGEKPCKILIWQLTRFLTIEFNAFCIVGITALYQTHILQAFFS